MPGRIRWVDVKEVTEIPKNVQYVQVIRDSWWQTNKEGQVSVLVWGRGRGHVTPQCNTDLRIVKMLGRRYGGGEPVFIPIAFIPHECERD